MIIISIYIYIYTYLYIYIYIYIHRVISIYEFRAELMGGPKRPSAEAKIVYMTQTIT